MLMTLVVNARDAMPQGGRLTIQISRLTLESPLARGEQSVPVGPWVTLEVRDTGVGMDKETLSRIFEPFFTRKEQGRGTGLGLAMVYGIIEQSGGHIHASSEPGAGSCFTLYLPRAASDPASSEEARPAETFQAGCETVLLVEDEPPLRALAREMLECEGYRVLVAGGGPEALEGAAGFSRPNHQLVTDVVIPGPSGRPLAPAMRETQPQPHLLFLPGYTQDALVPHRLVR